MQFVFRQVTHRFALQELTERMRPVSLTPGYIAPLAG
jgi:hypothetical protein